VIEFPTLLHSIAPGVLPPPSHTPRKPALPLSLSSYALLVVWYIVCRPCSAPGLSGLCVICTLDIAL
jgi:hypothetical protein